ncbi:type I restriction-modification system, specificity subunit S [Lacticaseibacillus casei 21/1]|jgi:type I restriction enzyme S subunit|nr:type I restriction-modification system, specificity subunit S [Lacticaseibacillus casei 21/1]
MSKDAKNVPALRFKGYSDAWEKRKLGEVVERVTRKNRDLVSTRPLTISAQDGLVDQRKFFSKTVASKNISNYFLLKAGDFAYNKSYSVGYPWGAVKRLDKYPSGVLSTLYIVFKPKKINSQFLVTYFEGTTWYVSVSKVASEGARNHGLLNISASDFFDQQLFFPTKKTEQESIGLTIKVLDDLIAATQDKIDALEQAKKALLQRLFDQSWRFKGYSDPWEKRKYGDIAKSFQYGLNAPAKKFDGINKYLRITDIDDLTRLFKQESLTSPDTNLSNASTYLLKQGDVLFARTGASTGKTYKYRKGDGKVYFAGFLIRADLKPKFDSEFFYQTTLTDSFLDFVKVTSQRSGQPGINSKEYANKAIQVPELSEQQRIGSVLAIYDNLIAATQSRLSSLELLKKALLQDLFI